MNDKAAFSDNTLTLQAFWGGHWRDAGQVVFAAPEKGLTGRLQFYYDPGYVNAADDFRSGLEFIDERAVGVNVPGNFSGHYTEREIAPVLRDIIPQGAGRRSLEKLWGLRDTGPSLDFRLLQEGCVAPVGNLRIKEAAERFAEKTTHLMAFTRDEVAARNDELIEYAYKLGIAVGGATGAGGDAPKLLLEEGPDGLFYLEGTLGDGQVLKHWLVKFPRGRMDKDDEDILRGEAIFYQTLNELGFNTIQGAQLQEGRVPSLWLPRFDRSVVNGSVNRYGLESVYSMLQTVGDGMRLLHTDVFEDLCDLVDSERDDLLVEYLLRDAINEAIGNTDNHGRNTALLKRDGLIQLAPAYDLAPMVLDREAIARSTRWPDQFRSGHLNADYPAIIADLADDAAAVAERFQEQLETLTQFQEVAERLGLPERIRMHPRISFNKFEAWLTDVSTMTVSTPNPTHR